MNETPLSLADAKAGTPAPHVGIVAVVGRTNAGKSTLVNKLLGEKVSIVSPVVQTTRSVIRGVLTEDRGQIVLLDTPGLHQSRSLLGTEMNKRARATVKGADAVLLLLDGSKAPQLEDEGWIRRLVRSEVPVYVFLNKADLSCREKTFRDLWDRCVAEDEAREAEAAAREAARPADEKPAKPIPPWKRKGHAKRAPAPIAVPRWFVGSASTGQGTGELVDALFKNLPEGPLLFDGDTLTDYPQKLAVADIIREKLFKLFHDELPHSIGVQVDTVTKRDDGSMYVKGTVYVRKSNQKGIVLGEKGRTLRSAKRSSEAELKEFFGAETEVELWIRVEPDWDENFFLLRQIGYC